MKTCPVCGGKLIQKIDGSSLVIKCSDCDYNVATSDISLIYEDETQYTVTIENGNNVQIDTITTLKNILNLSTTEVVNIIKNACPYVLFVGNAVDVNEIKTKLEMSNIKFSISPKFKW